MRARWHAGRCLRILAAPLLLGGVLTGLGSAAAAAATCQAWTGGQPANPNDTDSGDSLTAVVMVSACDVWTVGARGSRTTLIEHWTGGSTWTVVPSPNPGAGFNALTSVSALSPTDIWAAGAYSDSNGSVEKGLILHWNGVRWLQAPSPNPGTFTDLTGIRATSANDAWAVGTFRNGDTTQTLILHWDGTTWTQAPDVPSPGGPSGSSLTGVTATSASNAWAVGDYITDGQSPTVSTLVLHWDGTSWTQQKSPNPGPVGLSELTSVAATSPTDAWAVGLFPDGAVNHTLILHWDGVSWTRVPSPDPEEDNRLDGVAASSAGNAVAVGTGQSGSGRSIVDNAVTLRWDGTAWTTAPSIHQGGRETFNALAGVSTISPTEAWAVGFFGPTPTQTLAFHLK